MKHHQEAAIDISTKRQKVERYPSNEASLGRNLRGEKLRGEIKVTGWKGVLDKQSGWEVPDAPEGRAQPMRLRWFSDSFSLLYVHQ